MNEPFLLDTSAILAYAQGESGRDMVEKILDSASKGAAAAYISFVSLTEIYYVTWRAAGEGSARDMIVHVKSLPLETVNSSERIALAAGRIKATNRLSVADAIVAATAQEKGAVLVHRDDEMLPLSCHMKTLALPRKR